ncbi:MAG: insulinase family protein, partial [Pseudarcicella sp.]|nr:insulinase family protein [Pseudarcicella sp.]
AERTKPITLEKFEKINPQNAFNIYKERFADASDFTFFFVGNLQPDSIKPLLEKYLGSLPNIQRKETFKDLGIRPIKGNITKTVFKGKEPKAKVSLIWTGEYKSSPENKIQLNALAEVLEIKLIEKLREEEAGVYGVGVNSSSSTIPAKRFKFGIGFNCAPENVDKLINKTLEEIKSLQTKGALQIDIDKFKTETKRQTELQIRENGFWLGYLQSQYVNKSDLKDVLNENKLLEKITPKSTQNAANLYLSNNNIRLIMLPEKQ